MLFDDLLGLLAANLLLLLKQFILHSLNFRVFCCVFESFPLKQVGEIEIIRVFLIV